MLNRFQSIRKYFTEVAEKSFFGGFVVLTEMAKGKTCVLLSCNAYIMHIVLINMKRIVVCITEEASSVYKQPMFTALR